MSEPAGAERPETRYRGQLRAQEVVSRLEHLSPREQLDRLAGDRELVEDLRRSNWQGPEWDFVEELLAGYGVGVIGVWALDRSLERRCREKGWRFKKLPSWVWEDEQERQDLVIDIVWHALRNFREVVLPDGKWDPAKGAALSTYFIGQCLIQYANAAKRWYDGRERSDAGTTVSMEHRHLEEFDTAITDSTREDEVLYDILGIELLQSRPERSRKVLMMTYFGYSQQEIANHFNTTESAIAMLVSRERKILRGIAERGSLTA